MTPCLPLGGLTPCPPWCHLGLWCHPAPCTFRTHRHPHQEALPSVGQGYQRRGAWPEGRSGRGMSRTPFHSAVCHREWHLPPSPRTAQGMDPLPCVSQRVMTVCGLQSRGLPSSLITPDDVRALATRGCEQTEQTVGSGKLSVCSSSFLSVAALDTSPASVLHLSVQFSSVSQLCLTLCDPMDCSTPGLPVLHQLPEFTQTHVHCVGDAIQPSHPLSFPSPPTFSLSQHQHLF